MLAATALTQVHNVQLRCGACRYFTHDRCCNATARLQGEEGKAGECPQFRFAHSSEATRAY